jgi:hypothetical protein
MIITDVSCAPGAVAERLTSDEAEALLNAAAVASARLLTEVRQLELRGSMADEARALAGAVRKLEAIIRAGGLELRAVEVES